MSSLRNHQWSSSVHKKYESSIRSMWTHRTPICKPVKLICGSLALCTACIIRGPENGPSERKKHQWAWMHEKYRWCNYIFLLWLRKLHVFYKKWEMKNIFWLTVSFCQQWPGILCNSNFKISKIWTFFQSLCNFLKHFISLDSKLMKCFRKLQKCTVSMEYREYSNIFYDVITKLPM